MASKIEKILYATDLSKNSTFAYQHAADLAKTYDAKLYILHVFEAIPENTRAQLQAYLTDEMREQMAHRDDEVIEDIKKRLQTFCDNVQKDDPTCVYRVEEIMVQEGYPSNVILEKAEELDCDLIVMGTHGKGFLSHAILGSVAEKVLRHAKRPVFVVPLPRRASDAAPYDI